MGKNSNAVDDDEQTNLDGLLSQKNIAYIQNYIANAKNISQFLKKNLLAAS